MVVGLIAAALYIRQAQTTLAQQVCCQACMGKVPLNRSALTYWEEDILLTASLTCFP